MGTHIKFHFHWFLFPSIGIVFMLFLSFETSIFSYCWCATAVVVVLCFMELVLRSPCLQAGVLAQDFLPTTRRQLAPQWPWRRRLRNTESSHHLRRRVARLEPAWSLSRSSRSLASRETPSRTADRSYDFCFFEFAIGCV